MTGGVHSAGEVAKFLPAGTIRPRFAPTEELLGPGPGEFTIEHAKNRSPGGLKEPKTGFRVIDTTEGGLDIVPATVQVDAHVAEAMDAAVEFVRTATRPPGTNALKSALNLKGFGGSTLNPTLDGLRLEDPPRIRQVDWEVVGADGKRRKGLPWVVA